MSRENTDTNEFSDSAPLHMGLANKKIAHYRLIKELGQGGQGYVYLAEDKKLGRNVALKILIESARMSTKSRLRFEREAETASKLDHPGIARVYEVGEDLGLAFIGEDGGGTALDRVGCAVELGGVAAVPK